MIHLNELPTKRKEKAREYLETEWPELVDELKDYRREFGDVQVYFEMKRGNDER